MNSSDDQSLITWFKLPIFDEVSLNNQGSIAAWDNVILYPGHGHAFLLLSITNTTHYYIGWLIHRMIDSILQYYDITQNYLILPNTNNIT